MSPLVRALELADELARGTKLRLLDVRWRLDRPEGRIEYLDGHIPGAIYVDLERELAAPGAPEHGRHPLPAAADFRTVIRRWGISSGDRIVVYDDNDAVPAARAWWMLRQQGFDVRVLDGGLRSWLSHGLRLERRDGYVRPSQWDGKPQYPEALAEIEEVARIPQHGVLIDVRAPHHYRGAVAGLDPSAGHIPGAVNLPTVTHIGPDGLLRTPEEIRANARELGITADVDVVVYCNSGIPSMHSALAFAVAGIHPRVFVGSWSQWSRSEGRPVAIGASPAGTVVASF